MSLRLKLVAIILFVALVPLSISALTTLSLHRRAHDARISELHRMAAESGAALAQAYLENARRSLQLSARSIRWDELTDDERKGAVSLIYRQLDDAAVAALLDAKGDGMVIEVYLDAASLPPELKGHPFASPEDMQALSQHIPFREAQADAQPVTLGEAFATSADPMVPMAVGLDGKDNERWVVAVALSLRGLCHELARVSGGGSTLFLVDPRGRRACYPRAASAFSPASESLVASLRASAEGNGELARFRSDTGEEMVAAVARGPHGWTAVAEQPLKLAFADTRRITAQTLFWIGIGVVAAVVAGLFLAQSINRPVHRLVQGALELAKGHFDHRLPVESQDELGKLSEAFNHMGKEIQSRDQEIRAWNQELQKRVDDQTLALKETHEQLVHSQKISAVTGLGAGIAHEINNPLTGVLGLTQVALATLRKKHNNPDLVELLTHVEQEAHRIRRIIRTFMGLVQNYAGEGFAPLEINDLLDSALQVAEGDIKGAGIEVVREFSQELPPILGNKPQLEQVFLQLFSNSRTAMNGHGGKITLSTTLDSQLIKVCVTDTGKGIPPEHLDKIFEPFFTTKDDWRSQGLGLTVAFRVVEEHHGKIKASSEVGRGTTMTITLPAARRSAHLR